MGRIFYSFPGSVWLFLQNHGICVQIYFHIFTFESIACPVTGYHWHELSLTPPALAAFISLWLFNRLTLVKSFSFQDWGNQNWTQHSQSWSDQCQAEEKRPPSFTYWQHTYMQPKKLLVTFVVQARSLARGQLGVSRDPKALFCRAALRLTSPSWYQCLGLLLPKCRTWNLELPILEFHEILLCPSLIGLNL